MRQTVVGVFDRYAAAQHAAELLQDRGIEPDCIHVTSNDESGSAQSSRTQDVDDDRGLLERVRDFFAGVSDDEDVDTYSEAVRRGGAVVKVDVDEEPQMEIACSILEQAGAVDIDEQASQWGELGGATGMAGSSGTSGLTGVTGTSEPTRQRGARSTEGEEVIPVVREEIAVGKRAVQAGKVRVYAHMVEEPVRESVTLREEHAHIERRPVDREATAADLDAAQERTIEVTETEERPVIEKTARVVEEVTIGKEVRHREETIEDTLRHTQVEVQNADASGTSGSRAYDDYADDFRTDFTTRYEAQGGRYEDYEPAYRFGHSLRGDRRYAGRSWTEVEGEAQRDWSTRYPDSPWQRFKDAVRHAWERVTD